MPFYIYLPHLSDTYELQIAHSAVHARTRVVGVYKLNH